MQISDLDYRQRYETLAQEEAGRWEEITRNLISNWTELFREQARRHAARTVIRETESGASYSYADLDRASDAVADHIRAHIPDSRIGLHYKNSFLFLAALIGINKTGRLAILFNTNEPQERLQHLARQADTESVLGDAIAGLRRYDIGTMIDTPVQAPIGTADLRTTLDDPAFVIFTSGTSGPSKPALFSHRRMIGAGIAWSLRTFMQPEDNCYITLPLYHGNALAVAFSAVVTAGATATLRPKFSVTHFFEDVERFGVTHMVYIGELWRYLLNRHTEPRRTTLHTIFGNGLHKNLWIEATNRYGIRHVVEHFGATEMPASALTNWMDAPGYCGYIPPDHPDAGDIMLIDESGRPVPTGESGEAIFRVPGNRYRGYLDPTLDAPKTVMREGIMWWRSGDLLRRNEAGFFTFVDRAGDSYRYKGENVSTKDVEEALAKSPLIEEAVVYGIRLPHIEGKIGMASILPSGPLDEAALQTLLHELKQTLAPYALPHFLRIREERHPTTSTLKFQKKALSEEGIERYDTIPHYILADEGYIPLDQTIYEALQSGDYTPGAGR